MCSKPLIGRFLKIIATLFIMGVIAGAFFGWCVDDFGFSRENQFIAVCFVFALLGIGTTKLRDPEIKPSFIILAWLSCSMVPGLILGMQVHLDILSSLIAGASFLVAVAMTIHAEIIKHEQEQGEIVHVESKR